MLLMLSAIAAPIGIDATGMEPQLRIIKSIATQHGWSVTCEGHAGEEGVVRLEAPAGTDASGVKVFADSIIKVASSTNAITAQEAASKTCDREAMSDGNTAPQRALAFGPASALGSLATIARECGYQHVYVRPRNAADDDASSAYWVGPPTDTLDTGEDVPSRYGPRVCFMNLGIFPSRNP
jgi:hypothetical protein